MNAETDTIRAWFGSAARDQHKAIMRDYVDTVGRRREFWIDATYHASVFHAAVVVLGLLRVLSFHESSPTQPKERNE